ncbi:CLUMA_CG015988, isoform A [Clunio marinus]|uniref:CLUMA_CG015988, isoform A n=1 Tax=Clunio marinus TaxID=568069 RepID=A0A1J1IW77_9DIPT|nr:CLUMA_CG015988, isoform A [Clunio marinus]
MAIIYKKKKQQNESNLGKDRFMFILMPIDNLKIYEFHLIFKSQIIGFKSFFIKNLYQQKQQHDIY